MSHFLSRDDAVSALRAAADLVERLPFGEKSWFVSCEAYNLTAEQLAAAARVGGRWEKDVSGQMFEFRQGVVELHADRDEVCTAVSTGRTVTVRKVVSAAVTADVEVPEVVWECRPLLSNAGQPANTEGDG